MNVTEIFEVIIVDVDKAKNSCGMTIDKMAMKLWAVTKELAARREERKRNATSGMAWLDKWASRRGLRPAFCFVKAS